ncbi:MAG: dephospho-CoA kinase [Bacteroidales bacterium]|nr:dephospho-CoA kinase [Bacteroidales bacterium]
MIKVGLTGGIGSGKSLIAEIFSKLGIPVYMADREAKKMLLREDVISILRNHFTASILFADGSVNRKELASIVFNNTDELRFLNSIIHPLVGKDFEEWCKGHLLDDIIVHEAAILFESGFYQLMDRNIVVYAPRELCVERVVIRDKVAPGDVLQRMSHQSDPELLMKQADFIITNDNHQPVLPQVLEIREILKGIARSY